MTGEVQTRRVRLGDVIRQVQDKLPSPFEAGISHYVPGGGISSETFRLVDWRPVDDGGMGPAFHMRFVDGQTLYKSRVPHGVAVADRTGICANTTFVLQAIPGKLLPELLPFLLVSDAFRQFETDNDHGSTNLFLNFNDIARFEFNLAPINEQQRIAAALTAFRRSREALTLLRDRARLLQYATLEEIFTKAAALGGSRKLEDLVEPDRPITYGILKPGTGFAGGIPVIRVADYAGEVIDEADLLLTAPEIDAQYKRSRLRTGDLLLSITGTIGRTAWVPETLDGANITQQTARISLRADVNPVFVRALLQSPQIRRKIRSNIPLPRVPGSPMPKSKPRPSIQAVNLTDIRQLEVPLPSRAIQNDFADVASAGREALDACEHRLTLALALETTASRRILGGML